MDIYNDLVSIIIPTHNRADLIQDTLISVINQSYSKIELIVVNDHSIDNTDTVVNDFINSHPEKMIIYIKSAKTGGCAARNLGLSVSKGDYIQFFDDDDIMCEDYIKNRLEFMKQDDFDYVACNYSCFDSNTGKVVVNMDVCSIDHTIESHIYNSALTTQLFLMSRRCVDKIGFWNEDIKRCQDMAFFHRLFLYKCKGCWIDQELFSLRIHPNRITNNSVSGLENCFVALESIKKEWKNEKRLSLNNILTYIQLHLIKLISSKKKLIALKIASRLFILHLTDLLRLAIIWKKHKTSKLSYNQLVVE